MAEGSSFSHECPQPEADIRLTIYWRCPTAALTFIPARPRSVHGQSEVEPQPWPPLRQEMFPPGAVPSSWKLHLHKQTCPGPARSGMSIFFFFSIASRQHFFICNYPLKKDVSSLKGIFGSSPARCTSRLVLRTGDSVASLHTQDGAAVAYGK